MSLGSALWSDLPSFREIAQSYFNLEYDYLMNNYKKPDNFPWSLLRVQLIDVILALILIKVWIFCRVYSYSHVFQPICDFLEVTKENERRAKENLWNLACHIFMCSAYYMAMVSIDCYTFWRPLDMWKKSNRSSEVPFLLYFVNHLTFSYYGHALYVICCFEEKRKDSQVMIVHHIIVMVLAIYGLCIKFLDIGIFMNLIHDVSDIFIDGAKVCLYCKTRKTDGLIREMLIGLNIIMMLAVWIIGRMYLFPLKALHAIFLAPRDSPDFWAVALGSNMLVLIYFMDIYWFYFIIKLLYSVIFSGVGKSNDPRESDLRSDSKEKDD